jgi:Fe-S-cluster containining protein
MGRSPSARRAACPSAGWTWKVQRWRGGDEQSPPCPFLAVEGERFACGVYPYRPSCCRSFPVFRIAEADREPKFYLQEVSCPAAETDRGYTVAQWIAHEGLAPYHRENDRFLTQVKLEAERGPPVCPPAR